VAQPSVDLLQRVPLFADLDRRELQRISGWFKEREFKAGETVVEEGSGGAGFFLVEEGEARVSVHGEERGRIGPGDYFGEVALLDEGARTATITAESDLKCHGLTFWDFRPMVENDARIAWALLQALAKKLRSVEQLQA
jgi:CRP/FNR family transcriptional regulator, cyclic AMP receptor protein